MSGGSTSPYVSIFLYLERPITVIRLREILLTTATLDQNLDLPMWSEGRILLRIDDNLEVQYVTVRACKKKAGEVISFLRK